ncbi:MAG TPA: hypothetical protein VNW24_06150 [Stellaceae bacterium]|nr:hypothetical protein [Stellaceae bacterium]
MPKLPEALGTPQDVGAVAPDPSRIIPHYEAGQVGAAMQGFARDLGASANQVQDVQDRLSRAAAEQDFISKKLDIDQQFAGDTDYATAPQRYRQALLQTLNDTSQSILGPVQRADFQQQMSRFTEVGVDSILRQSVAKARDAGRANVTQAAGATVSDALRTPDEANLNPIFNALNDRIQASMEAGYLSPEEAVALRKSTAQSYVSQRGWRLADADPQQAVDTLRPSALGDDGQPSFAKVGDWRDLIDPGERTSILGRAQQNLEAEQRAADIEALRQQRQQQKAEADAGNAIAARYVSQLAVDPTSVDVGALARERFPDSQQDTRQALLGAAQTAIAQAGDKTAAGYGLGFWQAFNRVTAADGAPNKITDPAELLKLAGPEGGGALTMQGVQQLQRFLDASKTVEDRAQSAMEQNFLRQAHAAITGTEAPADPASEARFQNFLGAYFPALQDSLASGKSAMQLLSAASSDYLGKLIPAFAPPPTPRPDTAAAAATSDRRDKDIETPPDNRSFWERLGDRWGAAARSWNEDRQAQLQNVDPVLTRQFAPRLGSLGEDDAGVIIVPDSRGILDKTIRFDPTKHVILGNDIYERVPEAEESPRLSGARAFLGGLGPGPLAASKLAGGIEAAGAGARAAEVAGAEAQGTRAAEAASAGARVAETAGAAPTEIEVLSQRAQQIHNILDSIPRKLRTTAALSTDGPTIVGGGAVKDLESAQEAALQPGEISAKLPGAHAEVTVLTEALKSGLRPRLLATTRDICPDCRRYIESLGGRLTSETTAIFPSPEK